MQIIGDENSGTHLRRDLKKSFNVLVGENDAGKTAVMDATRLCLGTTLHDYFRFEEGDFHKRGDDWPQADTLSITCKF